MEESSGEGPVRYTMFFEQLNSPEVGRSGNVLVGFFSHEDVSIDVGVGPDIRCTTLIRSSMRWTRLLSSRSSAYVSM